MGVKPPVVLVVASMGCLPAGLTLSMIEVAVFAICDVFLLRVDAVQKPGELFAVAVEHRATTDDGSEAVFTRRDYEALRRETSVFTDILAMLDHAGPLEGRLTRSAFVSGNFFQLLGVEPALGRPLLPDDDRRGGGRPVIVLSHAGWHRLFHENRR